MTRMNGFCLVAALLGLLNSLMGGCSENRPHEVKLGESGSLGLGVLAVDVQNQLGEVVVTADPSIELPVVEAIPMDITRPMGRINRDPGTVPWAAATIAADEGGRVLRVLCTAREGQPVLPVYVHVRVPACEGVRVRNRGGPVRIEGVGGSIDIETAPSTSMMWDGGAAIRVSSRLAITSSVSLSSEDGEVVLAVGRGSAGMIDAKSPDTRIELASKAGLAKVGGAESRTSLGGGFVGSFNGGTNPFTLRSGQRVRFSLIDAPAPAAARPAGAQEKPSGTEQK